ncbi:hypothetical protein F5884DRAFT_896664 [Xylogone sp. PMI_703]|nr:hypothetical protein F5884DRAFT_896664 [Xylogone sp. PMI_703]
MSGFPHTQPAFTARLVFDQAVNLGATPSGYELQVVRCIKGTIESEPGFLQPLTAEVVHGDEWMTVDVSKKFLRTKGQILFKVNDKQKFFKFTYEGCVEITPEFLSLGKPGIKGTKFGHEFIQVKFETASGDFDELVNSLYVASDRFLVEKGEIIVECKISKIVI